MTAHFSHIEAYYKSIQDTFGRFERFRYTPRQRQKIEALAYEYRRLSDCPAFVEAAYNNLVSQ